MILLTNDDGIDGEGLRTLASALKKAGHEVVAVAPRENNSAVSHKLTMRERLQVSRADFGEIEAYSVMGTPADCVLIALNHLKIKPDLLISGINAGLNLGIDTIYSGTVAGATEGALCGVPSIALSQRLHPQDPPEKTSAAFRRAAQITISRLAAWLRLAQDAEAVNINLPDCEPKGYKFCPVTRSKYRTQYVETEEGLRFVECEPEFDGGGDVAYLLDGYATVTPITTDLTDFGRLEKWSRHA